MSGWTSRTRALVEGSEEGGGMWDGVERRRQVRRKLEDHFLSEGYNCLFMSNDLEDEEALESAGNALEDFYMGRQVDIYAASKVGIPYRQGKIARIESEKRTSPMDQQESRRV